MVVAVFVLCIALGSFAVSALRSIPPVADRRVAVAAGRPARAALLRAREHALLRPRRCGALFTSVAGELLPVSTSSCSSAILLVLCCVPIGLSGALLPLRLPPPARRAGRARGRRRPALRLEHDRLAARRAAGRLRAAVLRRSPPRVSRSRSRALVLAAGLLSVLVLRLPALAAAVARRAGVLGAALVAAGLGAGAHELRALPLARRSYPQTFSRPRCAVREPHSRGSRSSSTTTTPPASVAVIEGRGRALDRHERQARREPQLRLHHHGARGARPGAARESSSASS